MGLGLEDERVPRAHRGCARCCLDVEVEVRARGELGGAVGAGEVNEWHEDVDGVQGRDEGGVATRHVGAVGVPG